MAKKDKEIIFLDPENKITWDHKEIKKWIEKHGGKPAIFDDPEAKADRLGIRVDFGGKSDEKYMHDAVKTRRVSWRVFFDVFEKLKLAFIYNQKREPTDLTLAYKLIPREAVMK